MTSFQVFRMKWVKTPRLSQKSKFDDYRGERNKTSFKTLSPTLSCNELRISKKLGDISPPIYMISTRDCQGG